MFSAGAKLPLVWLSAGIHGVTLWYSCGVYNLSDSLHEREFEND